MSRRAHICAVVLLLAGRSAGAQDGVAGQSAAELERQAFMQLMGYAEPSREGETSDLLRAAATAGSAVAADVLGDWYASGNGVPVDPEESQRLHQFAAERGLAGAQFRLGLFLMPSSSAGIDGFPEQARPWLEAAAAQGDRRAMFALTIFYTDALGGEPDPDTFIALLTRSAELGEPAALRQLGDLLLNNAERRDPRKGIYALERAAATYPELAAEIGFHYFSGRSIQRDPEKAAAWLSRAAANGDLPSKVWLSMLLIEGSGIARDEVLAGQLRRTVLQDASPEVKNSVAWLLSIAPDPDLRDGLFAVRLMESLQDAGLELNAARMDTLAAAYAEVGRFEDAARYQQLAIDAYPAATEENTAGLRDRLALYQSGQPYHAAQ